MRLGAHMSIAGGIPLAAERAQKAGCEVLQIFVKNNNRWQGRPLSVEEALEFQKACQACSIEEAVGHAGYLINLASPQEDLWKRSIDSLIDELERAGRLSLGCLVVHPGSHMGMGESKGVRRVAQALNQISDRCDWTVPIALETTAGQGTSLGSRFEHLRDIMGGLKAPNRVAVCLDTCHIFAAGHEIRDRRSYLKTLRAFQRTVGLEKLVLLHLNDSRRALGSRVDRHEHIGKGEIGLEGFRWIMNDRRLRSIPKILETPKGKTHREDRRNLRVLRSLIR